MWDADSLILLLEVSIKCVAVAECFCPPFFFGVLWMLVWGRMAHRPAFYSEFVLLWIILLGSNWERKKVREKKKELEAQTCTLEAEAPVKECYEILVINVNWTGMISKVNYTLNKFIGKKKKSSFY